MRRASIIASAAVVALGAALAACQPKAPAADSGGALKAVPTNAPPPAQAAPSDAVPMKNGIDQSPLLPTAPDGAPTAPQPPAAGQPAAPATPPAPPSSDPMIPGAAQPSRAPTPPARPQASAFEGAFNLVGTEPFWNLEIRPGGLKLSRPQHEDLTAPNPGFTELGRSALWTATAGQSRLTVTVTRGACSDGMSDRTYAYTAKVSLWGTTLSGCASKVKI